MTPILLFVWLVSCRRAHSFLLVFASLLRRNTIYVHMYICLISTPTLLYAFHLFWDLVAGRFLDVRISDFLFSPQNVDDRSHEADSQHGQCLCTYNSI